MSVSGSLGSRWPELVAVLVTAALVGSALVGSADLWGGRDWDEFTADLYAARTSLVDHHELPLWMPYRRGGHDAFADPQALWLSPLGLLVLACGLPWGIRLFLTLAACACALGSVRLVRHLGAGPTGQLAGAVLLAASPPLGLYAAGGVPTFTLGLALLPWLVRYVLEGRWLAAGAVLALDFWGGDINHVVYHSLFLLLASAVLAARRRSLWPLALVTAVGASAFVLTAPRLVPAALLALEHPREVAVDARGALTVGSLRHTLLNRGATRHLERPRGEFMVVDPEGRLVPALDAPPGAHENTRVDWVNVGSYLGAPGLALAVAGLALLAWPRRARAAAGESDQDRRDELLGLTAAAAAMLWLAFGPNASPSPWEALHRLPVFASLSSPDRLVLYPFFVLAVAAATTLDRATAWLRMRRGPRVASAAAAVAVAVLLADVHPPARIPYRNTFVEEDLRQGAAALRPGSEGFAQVEAPFYLLHGRTYYGVPVAPFAMVGLGVTNGYPNWLVPSHAVPVQDAGYRGEAFAAGPGRASLVRATSRTVVVDVTPDVSALVVNQNWATGWRAAAPAGARCRRHDDGRIAVDLPPGAHRRVVLRYTSPGLRAGVWVGLLGAAVLAVVRWRLRAGTRALGGAHAPRPRSRLRPAR